MASCDQKSGAFGDPMSKEARKTSHEDQGQGRPWWMGPVKPAPAANRRFHGSTRGHEEGRRMGDQAGVDAHSPHARVGTRPAKAPRLVDRGIPSCPRGDSGGFPGGCKPSLRTRIWHPCRDAGRVSSFASGGVVAAQAVLQSPVPDSPHQSHPSFLPSFCLASHACNGLKYSTIARVLRSSPVASRRSVLQSRVPPADSIRRRNSPASRLPS